MKMKKIRGKTAVLGEIISTFIATIIIIIILLLFALLSGTLKILPGENKSGTKTEEGKDVGLAGISGYMNNYYNLVVLNYVLSGEASVYSSENKVFENKKFLDILKTWDEKNKEDVSKIVYYFISGSESRIRIYDSKLKETIVCDYELGCNIKDVIDGFGKPRLVVLNFPVLEFFYQPFDESFIKIEVQGTKAIATSAGG